MVLVNLDVYKRQIPCGVIDGFRFLSKVVLPQPDGPQIQVKLPFSRLKLIPFTDGLLALGYENSKSTILTASPCFIS